MVVIAVFPQARLSDAPDIQSSGQEPTIIASVSRPESANRTRLKKFFIAKQFFSVKEKGVSTAHIIPLRWCNVEKILMAAGQILP
jgi:hypothetical protein